MVIKCRNNISNAWYRMVIPFSFPIFSYFFQVSSFSASLGSAMPPETVAGDVSSFDPWPRRASNDGTTLGCAKHGDEIWREMTRIWDNIILYIYMIIWGCEMLWCSCISVNLSKLSPNMPEHHHWPFFDFKTCDDRDIDGMDIHPRQETLRVSSNSAPGPKALGFVGSIGSHRACGVGFGSL